MLKEGFFGNMDYNYLGKELDYMGVTGIFERLSPKVYTLELLKDVKGNLVWDFIKYFRTNHNFSVVLKNEIDNNSKFLIRINHPQYKYITMNEYPVMATALDFLSLTADDLEFEWWQVENEDKVKAGIAKSLKDISVMKSIDWEKEPIRFRKDSHYMTAYIDKLPNTKILLFDIDDDFLGDYSLKINRIHYGDGIYPFLYGKDIAERIFKELAKDMMLISSKKGDRSSSADKFWNRLKSDKDFEVIEVYDYQILLYKKSRKYIRIKNIIDKAINWEVAEGLLGKDEKKILNSSVVFQGNEYFFKRISPKIYEVSFKGSADLEDIHKMLIHYVITWNFSVLIKGNTEGSKENFYKLNSDKYSYISSMASDSEIANALLFLNLNIDDIEIDDLKDRENINRKLIEYTIISNRGTNEVVFKQDDKEVTAYFKGIDIPLIRFWIKPAIIGRQERKYTLNRIHYPSGIMPILSGTGIAKDIFLGLAKFLGHVATKKNDRSKSAESFWNRLSNKEGIDFIDGNEYSVLLSKDIPYYSSIKSFMENNI